jgi:hypothetical protein
VVLTVFVLAIAYVRASRVKALIYSLPVPFSCAYLATGMRINATHVTGLALVVGYNWAVYLLVEKARLPLLAAIALAAGGYVGGAMLCRPMAEMAPWLAAVVWLAGWGVAVACYRRGEETDHRSRSPWWIKAPAIFLIAMAVYNATRLLAGAVGTFPYAGVFTSYEMRHSLRSLAGRFTVNSVAILACLLTIALAERHVSPAVALGLGWIPVVVNAYWVRRSA